MDAAQPTSLNSNAILRVNLDAIAANYRKLRDRVEPAICAGVVKADAYGLGIGKVAPVLWDNGCRWFFVATVDEAIELRRILPEAEIAVLSNYLRGTEVELISNKLVPVLNDPADFACWSSASRAAGRKLPAIIQLDTGMSRLGMMPEDVEKLAGDQDAFKGFTIKFIMSHLASADVHDSEQNLQQLDNFRNALALLEPLEPNAKACFANSAGIFLGSNYLYNMVRPGIALYGGNPTPHLSNPMSPVVQLSARVLQVRDVPAGTHVGYSATWTAKRPSRIATLGLGYADGFLRTGSGKGRVAFGDLNAPIIGRISMDMTGIDVTDIATEACRPGDYVEIIGPNRPLDDVATDHQTISYEILTSLGKRYRRVYETSHKS